MSVRHVGRGLATKVWLKQFPTVRMRDPHGVHSKIGKLVHDGPSRLQVITDFDRTLSRTHYHGKAVSTSYCVFDDDNHVVEEYQKLAVALRGKYYPIEIDPNLTAEQKLPHMIQWYKESFDIILKLKVHINALPDVVRRADLHLRCQTVELFNLLARRNIPILVFSAGLGDVVRLSLEQQGALLSNVTILSNFLEYDSHGYPLKFGDPLLHMYNKNAQFPPAGEYYQSDRVFGRRNAVLLGDSLGDCTMADGAAGISLPPKGNSTVVKIAFLDHNVDDRLPSYLERYDIVLIDDQTMNVAREIFRRVCT